MSRSPRGAGDLVPLSPALADVAAAVHRLCFAAPWDAASMAAVLGLPGAFGWLALSPGAVLPGDSRSPAAEPGGLIVCRVAADEAEVLTVGVVPAWRRQGLGHRLIAAASIAAGRSGAALFLEVAADNAPALALYCAHGFAPVGRRRAYYSRPSAAAVDALVLRRDPPP